MTGFPWKTNTNNAMIAIIGERMISPTIARKRSNIRLDRGTSGGKIITDTSEFYQNKGLRKDETIVCTQQLSKGIKGGVFLGG
jgi:hypothetical protein